MTKEKNKNQNEEHGKPSLQLIINDERYEWGQEYITGAEIRKLGDISPEEEVFLAIKKPWDDEPVPNDKQINLARPEIEHFYSKSKDVNILVNGTPHKWDKKKINFKEVIILAFGNYNQSPTMVYTVAYEDGPKQNPEGSMFVDQEVFIKNKMIFHATATDKS
jgi:hypothetical protein